MKRLLLTLLALPLGCMAEAATSRELDAFFAREWQRTLEAQPTWAAILGERPNPPRWPAVAPAAQEAEADAQRRALTELDRLLATLPELSDEDRLNARLFRHQSESMLERHAAGLHLLALTPRAGIHLADELAASLPMKTAADFAFWTGLLEDFPRYLDETIALLREAVRQGLLPPREVMERVRDPLRQQQPTLPQDSPFFAPYRKIPFNLPENERQSLQAAGLAAVRNRVLPAWQRFETFFTQEFLPACLPGVGAWRWPGGEEKYALLARQHTTTTLSVQAIHEMGLSEVARLREALEQTKAEMGFRGSLPAFFERLRTHPAYFYDNADALLEGYHRLVEKIDPLLPRLFHTFPKTALVIESIPAKAAPHTSTAYYRRPSSGTGQPGAFTVNLHAPHKRPKWEMLPLTLHEALPGHHLQIALAQERSHQPAFRRHLAVSGYVEGWALYAEGLAVELGLETQPEHRVGRLVYDLWRSVRLVVDTGLHHRQWTRQEAIDYFLANCPKTRLDALIEVDRYIAWPGQALAYKIGQLKFRELRARAEKQLGTRFDVRAFHDAVLLSGTLPLDLLEEQVDNWIKSESAR